MKRIALLMVLLPLWLLFQNSAWVKLTLVRPAEIALPVHLKTLAIIDRTGQVENSKSKLEEVVTGEAFQQDEQAVAKLVDGTYDLCANYKRFTLIRTGERHISDGTKNVFPTPLNWAEVEHLCNKYKSDGIYSIEVFDSDFLITSNPLKLDLKDNAGNITTAPQFKATGVAVVNIGIRIYDLKTKTIADEFRTTNRLNFEASGVSVDAAVKSLLDKVEAVKQVSYETGFNYGKRISPWYYKVTRYFYNKPKKSKYLQQGVRKSEVADWEGAIESWEKVLTSKNKKDKKAVGEAAFNIAVAYEVLGDLEKAKEWAAKAYTEYEDKDANDYYRDLQNRIREENVLKSQLGE